MARGPITIDEKITEREKKKLEAEIDEAFGKVIEYCSSRLNCGLYSLTDVYTVRRIPDVGGDRLQVGNRLSIAHVFTEIKDTLRNCQLEPRVEAAMDKLLDSVEKKAARP